MYNGEDIRKKQEEIQRNILKGFEDNDIEKARSGVYADTYENKKLNRVGQQYGSKKEEETNHKSSSNQQDNNKSIEEHAKNTSDKTLKKVVEDENAPEDLRNEAEKELKNRGVKNKKKRKDIEDEIESALKNDHNDSDSFREKLFKIFQDSGLKKPSTFIYKDASNFMDAGPAYKAQVFLEQRKKGKSKEEAIVQMKKSWRELVGSEGY